MKHDIFNILKSVGKGEQMAYKYKVDLGHQLIDLDDIMDVLTGNSCTIQGMDLRRDLIYEFGDGGYKFIVDTLQEQVDNIKARQPSAE